MVTCALSALLVLSASVVDQRNLRSYIRSEMASRMIPGMQVAVIHHGKTVFNESFGYSNLEDRTPVKQETIFTINSMTKAITGVALMQLVQDGHLSLDDQLGKHLAALPDSWRKVTIRQLASHTSGLPDLLDENGELYKWADGPQILQEAFKIPFQFEPGTEARYNQTGYYLLGLIIQRYARQDFQAFIRGRQFEPCRLQRILYGDAQDVVPNRATSYRIDGQIYRHVWEVFPDKLRTIAGICTNTTELSKWLIWLDSEAALKPTQKTLMWTSTPTASGSPGWGIGWPMRDHPTHPTATSLGGGRNAIYKYLKDDLTVVVLSNLMACSPEDFIDGVAGFFSDPIRKDFPEPYNQWLARRELEQKTDLDGFAVYQEFAKKALNAKFDSESMIKEGYRYISQGRIQAGIRLFEFTVASNPSYWNAHDSLGDGYFAIKQFNKAKSCYQRALDLNPKDTNARDQLKVIAASGTG